MKRDGGPKPYTLNPKLPTTTPIDVGGRQDHPSDSLDAVAFNHEYIDTKGWGCSGMKLMICLVSISLYSLHFNAIHTTNWGSSPELSLLENNYL